MSLISPRGNMRWKEWIPLITQQQRLRNLIQIIAYNINQDNCSEGKRRIGTRYYYTLHLTTMSSPFYTSEKLDSENPKWSELDITDPVYGTASGVVVRVWQNYNNEDREVTVWGVCFSGLVYIGSQLSQTNPAVFSTNTIVFYMHGGYFTDPRCFKGKSPFVVRLTSVSLPVKDVKPSYSVELLSKIHEVQQAIRKQSETAENLRKQILMGGTSLSGNEVKEPSNTLRKLLNQSKPPKPQHHEILAVRKDLELVKFRVQLLSQEKSRKQAELRRLSTIKNTLYESNQDKGCELMEMYRNLKRDVECTKQAHQQCLETQEALAQASSQLSLRRKQLIRELRYIYPVSQPEKIHNRDHALAVRSLADYFSELNRNYQREHEGALSNMVHMLTDALSVLRFHSASNNGDFTICGIHLPNSEDFNGHDEIKIAAALGCVAHLVQMIAYFLHVPPRYPIIHFGSRSKIMDHVNANMPDKDRQFPLFSRGKDRLQFNYGVYLLNKNIAQLRWYCGIATNDLRTTLPNLASLLQVKLESYVPTFDLHKRSIPRCPTEISSSLSPLRQMSPQFSLNTASNSLLSYSLDKGLDRWANSKNQISGESGSLRYPGASLYSSSFEETHRNAGHQMFLQAWQGNQVIYSEDEIDQHSSLPIIRNDSQTSTESNLVNSFSTMSTMYHSLPVKAEVEASDHSTVSSVYNREYGSSLTVNNSDTSLEKAEEITADEVPTSSINSIESEELSKKANLDCDNVDTQSECNSVESKCLAEQTPDESVSVDETQTSHFSI